MDKENYVKQVIPKYSLTKGINEKKYRLISEQVINNLPDIEDWHDKNFLKKILLRMERKYGGTP